MRILFYYIFFVTFEIEEYKFRTDRQIYIYVITTRDSVKLKNKVGVTGAKFDMQAVETDCVFEGFAELKDSRFVLVVENIFAKINNGELRFGTKTTRGYGQVKLTVQKKIINGFEEYLDFDMFDKATWRNINGYFLA